MIKNIAKIATSHILVKGLGLLSIVIVLNFLSVEDFGKYSFYLVVLNLATILIDPYLSAYLIEFKTRNYVKYNFGLVLIPIFLIPFFYVAATCFIPGMALSVVLLFCGTFFISAGLKSHLNIKEHYYYYGLVDVIRQLTLFISTLVFFYYLNGKDYLQLLILNYGSTLVIMIFLIMLMTKKSDLRFNIRFIEYQKLFKSSKHLILYMSIIPLISFIDSFFIDSFLTTRDLGMYSFSLKIYTVSLMLVVPIFTVLNIRQIEVAQVNGYLTFFHKNKRKVFVFSVLFFVLAFLLNWLLTEFIYVKYEDSFRDTSILLFAAFIAYLTLPFSFLMAYKKYKYLLILGLLALFVDVFINYFFIARFGTLVAALSTLISQIIINLGSAVYSYLLLNKKPNGINT